MCLLVFAHRAHPRYPLILASNRDEFYDRPTRPARFWDDRPDLLAGKDLKAGGTWMGITRGHRFAALTNFRDMATIKTDAPSRGHIVTDFLTSGKPALQFLQEFQNSAHRYNGFNLLLGSTKKLFYFNNINNKIREVEPGYYALSNAFLDSNWPKTNVALKEFKESLQDDRPPNQNDLFRILQNRDRYPLDQLPTTGLPPEIEHAVSSIFITSENYGTRCSTVVLSSGNSGVTFTERTYQPGTLQATGEVEFSL